MTYPEFKNVIGSKLRKRSTGMTWHELRIALDLPYDRPCPEWTQRLEREIGLKRIKGSGRGLVWRVKRG